MMGLSGGTNTELIVQEALAQISSLDTDETGVEYALLAALASGHLFVVNFSTGGDE
jgi:hypothetical protein